MPDRRQPEPAAATPSLREELAAMTPRELRDCVTPLFELPGRFQHEALTELVIRCEVADRLLNRDAPA